MYVSNLQSLKIFKHTCHPHYSAYQLFNTSASNAKMVPLGLKTLIGAHGEPPLGLNYHYEIFFTQQGGLSNYEVRLSVVSSVISIHSHHLRLCKRRHPGPHKCLAFLTRSAL